MGSACQIHNYYNICTAPMACYIDFHGTCIRLKSDLGIFTIKTRI